MDSRTERFYLNDDDRRDQESRPNINAGRVYTERAHCDWCGEWLEGRSFPCGACGALLCSLCICRDERCPACTGTGREPLSED
jgi:hypothetical protein